MKLPTLVVLSALLVAPAQATGPHVVDIPEVDPAPVLLDGRIDDEEWRGAAIIEAAPGLRLLVRQSLGHVHVAVDTPGATPQPMDLYLVASDGVVQQLHASMQIGERQPTAANPDPEWRWGNHVDWIANEIKRDSMLQDRTVFSEQIFPADGTEYQIKRSRFNGDAWRVRLTVDGVPGNDRSFAYPAGSRADQPESWAVWLFDR